MFLRSPYCCDCRARRRRTRITITVLIVVAVAGLLHGHAQPARTKPSRAHAARTHSAQTAHARAATTGHGWSPAARPAPAGSAAALRAAGQDLSWAGFYGIQLPASASAGPRRTRGGLAAGFADSPRGALLAAINIGVRTAAQWGPAIFRPTITGQVTGPDTAALLRSQTSAYARLRAAAHARSGQPIARAYAAEVAYRFAAWTPAAATVDVVTAGPGSGGTTVLASTRIQVLWLRGDWRVVAPPGGDWSDAAAVIPSLAGYTIFPGER